MYICLIPRNSVYQVSGQELLSCLPYTYINIYIYMYVYLHMTHFQKLSTPSIWSGDSIFSFIYMYNSMHICICTYLYI